MCAVNPCDRCVLFDIFNEISALELINERHAPCNKTSRLVHGFFETGSRRTRRGPAPLQLYCFGVSGDSYWIITEQCATSLAEWRRSHIVAVPGEHDSGPTLMVARYLVYFRLFAEVSHYH